MTTNSYRQERDSIIRQFENLRDFSWNEQLNGQFALAGANLSNFLPGIDESFHAALFAGILMHRKLSILEQGRPEALEHLSTEGLDDALAARLSSEPCIICTFHTGSYRILNVFLGRAGIPFALVAGNAIIKKEGSELNRIFRECTGHDLPLINASDPRSVIRMMRELRQGRSLLFYIDGNTGSGEATRENNNSCIVPFLAGQLHARQGIAVLAGHAGVLVQPVVCYRPDLENIRLKFFGPVHPAGKGDSSNAAALTRHLYQLAEPLISLYPEQWEAWLYLHKSAVIDQPGPSGTAVNIAETRYQLDRNSFSLLTVGKKHFLMRKNTYSSFEIGEDLYNLLDRSTAHPIVADDQEKRVITQLLQENVLIKFKKNCRT